MSNRHDEIMALADEAYGALARAPITGAGAFDTARATLSAAVAELIRDAERYRWLPPETQPAPSASASYLVTDGTRVAPSIRGVIHNNPGSAWDWQYGEAITGWMPFPEPPK